jgi:hypothetical protein
MVIGFAVLSDLITTFYLIKTFYGMKYTSDRFVGFFVQTYLLLIVPFSSPSYSQDESNSQQAYRLCCQTWHSRHHCANYEPHCLFSSARQAVLDTCVLLYQQDICDHYE